MSKENERKWEAYHRENTIPALAKVELREQPDELRQCIVCDRKFKAIGSVRYCGPCYVEIKL